MAEIFQDLRKACDMVGKKFISNSVVEVSVPPAFVFDPIMFINITYK